MRVPLETGWLDLEAGLFVAVEAPEPLRPLETRLLRYLADRLGQPVVAG